MMLHIFLCVFSVSSLISLMICNADFLKVSYQLCYKSQFHTENPPNNIRTTFQSIKNLLPMKRQIQILSHSKLLPLREQTVALANERLSRAPRTTREVKLTNGSQEKADDSIGERLLAETDS